jgi:hypothetical protein
VCGGMLKAISRLARGHGAHCPRFLVRSPTANNTTFLVPSYRRVPRIGLFKRQLATTPAHHRSPQLYVQPSSGFCWIPPVVQRLLK